MKFIAWMMKNGKNGLKEAVKEDNKGIDLEEIIFKYDHYAPKNIIDNVKLSILREK